MIPYEDLLPIEKFSEYIKNGATTEYRNNAPFAHIAFDHVFNPQILEQVLAEFPSAENPKWKKMDSYHQIKYGTVGETLFSPFVKAFLHQLNSAPFLEFLEELTGITGLIPDPHFNGGGLHMLPNGGKLGVHADFNKEPRLKLDRRINVLIYLNKDWDASYGGLLELWDKDMQNCVKSYTPEFNRMAIFSTTDFSFHGNPQTVNTPDDRGRRSIALYYYTNGRPKEESSASHTTLFKLRPGERMNFKTRQVIKKVIPPIIYDIRDVLTQTFKSIKGK